MEMKLTPEQLAEIKERHRTRYITQQHPSVSGMFDIQRLLEHAEALERELGHERWQHAGCLTLAEGNQSYPPEELQSEAMKAVIRLHQRCDRMQKHLQAVADYKDNPGNVGAVGMTEGEIIGGMWSQAVAGLEE